MALYSYEIHDRDYESPHLPFIIHKSIRRHGGNVVNWHENIELLCCEQGCGTVYCDSREYPFRAGDCFVVPADALHSITGDPALSYHCLIIGNRFLEENGIDPTAACFQPLIRSDPLQAAFGRFLEAYDRLEASDGAFSVAQVRLRVMEILQILFGEFTRTQALRTDSLNSGRIKELIGYIKQNLTRTMTLPELAQQVGISKYHLVKEFKRYTGRSVFDFINALRCAQAQKRIRQGMRVGEAAASCGFENMSYFTRTYKKYMGVLPSQDR